MINKVDILNYASMQIKKYVVSYKELKGFKVIIDSDLLNKYKDSNIIYIALSPIASVPCGINTNEETLIIDIDVYLTRGEDKKILYITSDILKRIFARSIKVKNHYIHLNRYVENFDKDSIGWKSHIEFHTTYINEIFDHTIENIEDRKEKIVGTEKIEVLDKVEKMEEITLD